MYKEVSLVRISTNHQEYYCSFGSDEVQSSTAYCEQDEFCIGDGQYGNYCHSFYRVKEERCDGVDNDDDRAIDEDTCPIEQYCARELGCLDLPCYDSDEGFVTDVKGITGPMNEKYEDYCLVSGENAFNNYVNEYTCEGNSVQSKILECDAGKICSDGACVYQELCTDTDGGKFPNTKGITSLGDIQREDTCYVISQGERVLEYYCSEGRIDFTGIQCAGNCMNGACSPESATICYDSDGGVKYDIKGEAVKGNQREEDKCVFAEGNENAYLHDDCYDKFTKKWWKGR